MLCAGNRVCQQPQQEDGPGLRSRQEQQERGLEATLGAKLQRGPEGSIQEMGLDKKTSYLQLLSKGYPADGLNASCLPHKYEVHTGNST